MMATPPPTGGGYDEPIHCYHCGGETTMSRVVADPDGKPTCPKCIRDLIPGLSDKELEDLR